MPQINNEAKRRSRVRFISIQCFGELVVCNTQMVWVGTFTLHHLHHPMLLHRLTSIF
ncbi:hypothetical protein V6Z11_D09G029500 [Gossypium hirsutum]